MAEIKSVKALQVLDSRGNPTVQCLMETGLGIVSAMVPSGASTGKYEAVELRDRGKEFGGRGVKKAIANIEKKIAPKIAGMDPTAQEQIDRLMVGIDGTKNKSRLGANATLAVSLAAARAGALEQGMMLFDYLAEKFCSSQVSLPTPMLNIINGGKHAGFENDIQEHMIAPFGVKSFSEAVRISSEVYMALKGMLKKKYGAGAIGLGDEGGFAPPVPSTEKRLELIMKAVKQTGYGKKVKIALDCAASEFYRKGKYCLGKKKFNAEKLIDYYLALAKKFPIYSIEDPFAEQDWNAWQQFTEAAGRKLQIVGDDLLVTNTGRIKKAIGLNACNALLLKVNQIGTLTESFEAARLAKENGWGLVVSHRSGETSDSFIADLAVGMDAGQCKFGAPARGERTAKYNRLLLIEGMLSG